MLFSTLILLSVGIGCNSEPDVQKPDPKPETTTQKEPKKEFAFNLDTLDQKLIQEIALVPSPAEMQKALGKAGLQSKLGEW